MRHKIVKHLTIQSNDGLAYIMIDFGKAHLL